MAAIKGYKKKNTPIALFGILLVVLLILAYYISGIFLYKELTLNTLEEALADVFLHPLRLYFNEATPKCLLVAFLAWMILLAQYMTYNRNFQTGYEYGSGEWLDVGQANRELMDPKNDRNNRILSQNLKVGADRLSNYNMLIIGASGSYKTTSLMHQNLLQFGASFVVLDVKGDTQRKLGNAFKQEGYAIRSLNFKEPEKSDRYNSCVYIENEHDLLRVVKALQSSVRPPASSTNADPFWDDGVRLFLQCLFYCEWLEARESKRPAEFNNILTLVNMENQKTTDENGESISRLQQKMDALAIDYGDTYPPVRDYRKLKEGAPETVGSIVLMVNAMLSIAETAEVRRIFSGNDIDIRDIGRGVHGNPEKKTVLFLVIPDNNNAYNWIVSMFYTQMFDILIRLSDDELKAPLPIRVEAWMDEFYAGARPADSDVLLGVIRARNIGMIPMLQSVSQMKTLFNSDKWESMMDNLSAVMFLGSGPLASSTHKYISEALGKATIDTMTDNMHKGTNGSTGLNFARSGRELMTPDEVKQIPLDHCLVFLEARPPIMDMKAIPFDQPKLGYIAPKWLKQRYAQALSLGDYEHPVYTIYDPKHLQYITLDQSPKIRFLSPAEGAKYRELAKTDQRIKEYTIDEKDLLYINFSDGVEKSPEMIEVALKEALRREQIRLENVQKMMLMQGYEPPREEPDKTTWAMQGTFAGNLKAYFELLPPHEQEEILFAMDDGLTDEEVSRLIFMPYEDMRKWHKAYRITHEQQRKEA